MAKSHPALNRAGLPLLCRLALAVVALAPVSSLRSQEQAASDEPEVVIPESYLPQNAFEAFAALRRQRKLSTLTQKYFQAHAQWSRSFAEASTDRDRIQLLREPLGRTLAAELLALGKESFRDLAAVSALNFIVIQMPEDPAATESLRLITQHHVESPFVANVLQRAAQYPSHEAEEVLRQTIERNPDPKLAARARYFLAIHLRTRAEATFANDPASAQGHLRDAQELLAFIEAHHEAVPHGETTLAAQARAALDDLQAVRVGRPVADIQGPSVDGGEMRLADFRGRVVLLDFWSFECAPCLRMKPDQRALRARLDGEPFAMLGVVDGADREEVRHAIAAEEITWPCWWDGGDAGGAIARQWRVHGVPALFLIDANGVLRARFSGIPDHKQLDGAIQALLTELKPQKTIP